MANVVYTVDLGNGHVADIEGPEGATPEQLQAFVQQNPDAAKPQGSSDYLSHFQGLLDSGASAQQIKDYAKSQGVDPSQITGLDEAIRYRDEGGKGAAVQAAGGVQLPDTPATIGREAGIAARGAGEGLGDLGDLALQLNPITNLLNVLGIRGPSGRDLVRQAANYVGLPVAESGAENLLQAGAGGLASGLATGGVAPEIGLVNSALGGIGSSLGGEAARQSGAGPVGQLAASVAGGLPAIAGPAAASLARQALTELASPITRAGAETKAASLLQRSASDPEAAYEAIANRSQAPTPTPNAQPTLAEVAQDAGLAGFQRGQGNTNLTAQRLLSERGGQNAIARTQAASQALGEGSPQDVQNFARSQVSAAEGQSQRLTNEAQSGLSQAVEGIGPVADREATGQAARAQFGEAYDAAKARTREAYSAPVLQAPQPIKIPQSFFGKLRNNLDAFYGDGGGEIPAPLQNILNDVSDQNTTTRTLTNIDRRLADFAGSAQVSGNRAEAAFANSIRSDLGDVANQVAPKAYREALATAKAIRADQGTRFETGDVANAFSNDRFGNPTVGNTIISTRLVRPGAAGGDTADRLISAVGHDQAEGLVRQEFRRVAESANITNEKQAANLESRYADAARRFPALAQDLADIRSSAARLDQARNGDFSSLQKAIDGTPLARVADPSVGPSAFVDSLLQRKDEGRAFKALYGQVKDNDAALGGLRRSLGDFIENTGKGPNVTASGDNIPSVNPTRKAISTVLTRGGDALTNQQKIVLKLVGRDLEKVNFANTAAKPPGSETALNRSFTQLISAVPGAGKVKFLYNLAVDTLGNGQQVKDFINQAIIDPDFAATLLKRPTEKHWIQAQTALRSRNAALGAASASRLPTASNDVGFLTNQPSLAANPQQQPDQGGNGNAQQ